MEKSGVVSKSFAIEYQCHAGILWFLAHSLVRTWLGQAALCAGKSLSFFQVTSQSILLFLGHFTMDSLGNDHDTLVRDKSHWIPTGRPNLRQSQRLCQFLFRLPVCSRLSRGTILFRPSNDTYSMFFYKYIHALHHRNTDVEPFSGICMSPAEHIYYISSVAPSLYWHASPFLFLWNGIHLILSPGASHSGWEDHWHSDQFHVAHHRYFECNYGTPGMPFDRWFGCFRETLASQTKVYHGDAVECKSQQGSTAITARPDPKANLWGLPSWDQIIYHVAIALGIPLLVYNAVIHRDTLGNKVPFWYQAPVTAFLVSMGPLILAVVLSFVTASSSTIANLESFRNTMLYPFHKEALFGKFGISLVLGTLCSLIPVYHFIHTLLVQDPQDAIYHRIWGTAKLHSY